jgi:hypothetical protein
MPGLVLDVGVEAVSGALCAITAGAQAALRTSATAAATWDSRRCGAAADGVMGALELNSVMGRFPFLTLDWLTLRRLGAGRFSAATVIHSYDIKISQM